MRIYSFQILIWYQRRRSTTTASISHLLSKFRNLTIFLLRRFYLQRGQSRGHRRPYWFLPIRMFTSFRCNFSAKTKKWCEKNVPHRWNILFRTSPCKIYIIWTFNIGNRYGRKNQHSRPAVSARFSEKNWRWFSLKKCMPDLIWTYNFHF